MSLHDAATRHGIRPSLLRALVQQESGGAPWAYRPEPRYPYLWNVRTARPFRTLSAEERGAATPPADFPAPAGVSPAAEWWGQRASWGLGQIMGAVAREHGFAGRFLPQLCDPDINLDLCAAHLARFIERFGERDGLAAYNAGPGGRHGAAGQAYAAHVLQREGNGG